MRCDVRIDVKGDVQPTVYGIGEGSRCVGYARY